MGKDQKILLETGTNELEVVEFVLKYQDKNGELVNQYFGINVAKVKEIIRMPKLTKMPNLPDDVYGVFNLRNSIIPALDLNKNLFGVHNDWNTSKMIIAEFNQMKIGFIVRDVTMIHRISWSSIVSPDSVTDFNEDTSSIIGLIKFENRNVLMLDVEKIIADINPQFAIDKSAPKKMYDSKPKAITAEDSVTIRKMITQRLEYAGFEIESFNNGEEAWKRLEEIAKSCSTVEELNKKVNVVITDIEMPKMDGYTLTKFIKADSLLHNLPVIIFSSIISEDVLHKGKSVGADAQLTKPQIGQLLDLTRQILDFQFKKNEYAET